jgi:hypothetical protein
MLKNRRNGIMENFKALVDFLNTQSVEAVKSGNFAHVYPDVSVDESDGSISVKVKSAQIVFCFDKDGKFEGIVNYKE